MIAVHVSPWIIAVFYARKLFFLYGVPCVMGFIVATIYPIAQRTALQHESFLKVAFISALGPMLMLYGWMLTLRFTWTPVCYGFGYGVGAALLSRVHRIFWWPPRIETRKRSITQ